jgi:uncharacterized protein YaiE (UPF0345 family)
VATLYWAHNGAAPTTAAAVKVTTGTAIKTLLQVATPSTMRIKVVEWGISFDGSAAATPIECELIQTDVAATVTSFTPQAYDDPNGPASLCVGGTSATGYTATAEGTITATRYGDLQLIAPTNQYVKQFPLGREFQVPVSKFLRVRVTAGAAVSAYTYICWEE